MRGQSGTAHTAQVVFIQISGGFGPHSGIKLQLQENVAGFVANPNHWLRIIVMVAK